MKLSDLDGKTLVVMLEAGDEGELVDLMDERQNGFSVWGEGIDLPIAVVDGRLLAERWCTRSHLLAIEAHELGHIRLSTIDEARAELEGIKLLRRAQEVEAMEILLARGLVQCDPTCGTMKVSRRKHDTV